MVESFSQELQPPSRVLQKKEPGGAEGSPAQNPFWTTLHPVSCPHHQARFLPHCPVATGCSHKGAAARRIELAHC